MTFAAQTAPTPDVELNCRGLRCPLPIAYARHQLESMEEGQIVLLVATDPDIMEDMEEFIRLEGHSVVYQSEEAGDFSFWLRK